jgi:hypothetical protein
MWYNVGKRIVAVVGVAALAALHGVVNAQRGEDVETVRGTVEQMTAAPKGEVDGAKLSDGTWVHWPPHLESRFTAIVAKGDRIEATGRFERNREGVRWFTVGAVTNLRTNASRSNEDEPPPPPRGKKGKGKARERVFGPAKTVIGRVEQLTTAPKGEVDGAELDDGTVVHWPPHLERRFTAIVGKGDRIEAAGWMETKPRGERVLEVRTVTNLKTKESRTNEDAPPVAASGNSSGDVERRLRALEDQVDRLTREVRRLRRD